MEASMKEEARRTAAKCTVSVLSQSADFERRLQKRRERCRSLHRILATFQQKAITEKIQGDEFERLKKCTI
jgi:hypothetical protein